MWEMLTSASGHSLRPLYGNFFQILYDQCIEN